MQQPKLPSICLAIITTALLATSTASFAKHHKGQASYKGKVSYKGEASYKGEPMPAPCPQPLILRDGFYVGAEALYDSYRSRVTTVASVAGVAASAVHVIASNGWGGGIFGGYGMYFNNLYYLAGEVFVNGTSATQSVSRTTTDAGVETSINNQINVEATWGISVLPGLKLNDSSLGYIRLGYEQAKIRSQHFAITTVTVPITDANYNNNQWQNGFEYGVGIETAVYRNLSVRGEYDHTSFSNNRSSLVSVNTSDNQFNLGLIYHFA